MSTLILNRAIQDRWKGVTIAMAIVGAFLVLAMAAYTQIDTSLYTDLPEAMRAVMGIPDGADPAILAYSVMFGLITSLTLAGLAISIGASGIAGEERDGTIAVLLGNPRSRRDVLVAKSLAMVVLVVFGSLIVLGAGYLAPAIVDVRIGSAQVGAVVLHLLANSLLFGALAAAVGAWTGNRTLASAVPAGVMVLSYFAVGLLPMIESAADAAKVFPWYWFDGHDPLINGVAGGYLTLQLGSALGLGVLAWVGVQRRDLRKNSAGPTLLDRVREHPRIGQVMDRLAGSARVSRVWVKTASEGQALLVITATVMFAMMGLMMGPMYAALEGTLAEVSGSLPDTMLAIVGGGDMSSPEGWYRLETFGLMAPIAVTLVAANVGAKALAGEEARRTMGLLLGNPVSRRRVVLEKAAAMVIHTVVVGFALFAGVAGGSLVAGLGMDLGNIAAASTLATLLGLLFGSLALAVSAGVGSVRAAIFATIGVAGAAYAANSVLSVAESLERYTAFTPFDWYLGSGPLVNGMAWGDAALLGIPAIVLVGLATVLFDRRDLRRG